MEPGVLHVQQRTLRTIRLSQQTLPQYAEKGSRCRCGLFANTVSHESIGEQAAQQTFSRAVPRPHRRGRTFLAQAAVIDVADDLGHGPVVLLAPGQGGELLGEGLPTAFQPLAEEGLHEQQRDSPASAASSRNGPSSSLGT